VIYLDTHAVVRLYEGGASSFSREAQRALERDDDLRISPMVLLEMQFLYEIRRLRKSGLEIAAGLRSEIGVRMCDRPFADVARRAADERWTRDPFDRIIVAQARATDAALVTRDVLMQANYVHALG
jgi:PIN domain nuclease of toxin-antitoxin system